MSEAHEIVQNSNVSLVEGRGRERIFRVLGYNDLLVFVVELGTAKTTHKDGRKVRIFTPGRPSKSVRNRLTWSRSYMANSFASGRIARVAEHGIPVQMSQVSLAPGTNSNLDLRRNVVAYIDQNWGDRILEDSAARVNAVQTAADRFDVSLNSARKWLETHLYYGRHENALVEHNWLKGAPGVSRRGLLDVNGKPAKLGRRTDSEKAFKNGHKRMRVLPRLLARYDKFIRDQAYNNNDKFPLVYERWIESQIAFNRDENGELRSFPIDPKKLPGDSNMRRIGRQLFKAHRVQKDREKRPRPGNNGGSAQDIVHDQLPVLDIDGTVAPNFVLFGDKHYRLAGEGKPTVLLAVDRASLAIVGWYVSFGAENGDAYLNCVFSASIDKTRDLHRWDVPHLKGFVHGCTSEVFIDRGPGISLKTQTSLVKEFRHAVKMAEPGAPAAKGHAEQVMLYFQKEIANLPGSTFETGDKDEDQKRRKHARKGAITMAVFMKALLKAISRRNLELDASHLLTPAMVKADVLPCPAEIFEYNKRRRRGDAAWDLAPEDVFKRLCVSVMKKVPKGIVTLDKREFSSSELWHYASTHAKMHAGASAKIRVYVVPNAPFLLLWELPEGGLGLLEATESTRKFFEDEGFEFSIDFQNSYKNHLVSEMRIAARRKNNLADSESRTTPPSVVSNAKQAKIARVERNAKAERQVDATEDVSARTQARKYHERENVEAVISDFCAVPVADADRSKPIIGFDEHVGSINDEQDLFIDM
ncbi:hypothetical protein [Duganella sp. S19_KUP01_CR8]|uniref:hypothetical protein n=1 Tax=Duganella sp. S19_KUP01_CR8 TaxID=3025502 RepID=UPI002FCDAD04